jgi:hypothetical protein
MFSGLISEILFPRGEEATVHPSIPDIACKKELFPTNILANLSYKFSSFISTGPIVAHHPSSHNIRRESEPQREAPLLYQDSPLPLLIARLSMNILSQSGAAFIVHSPTMNNLSFTIRQTVSLIFIPSCQRSIVVLHCNKRLQLF